MNDEELIATLRRDADPAAFRELVERYQGRVIALVTSILGPVHAAEAEEVAQDVFVRVYQRLDQLGADGAFGSWLYRIAYNEALDHKARARHQRPHLPEATLVTRADPRPGGDPHAVARESELRRKVLECMERLPELYRAVLNQRYWLGLGVAEIAEILDAPAGTVKSYLFRARRRLHRLLAKEGVHDAR